MSTDVPLRTGFNGGRGSMMKGIAGQMLMSGAVLQNTDRYENEEEEESEEEDEKEEENEARPKE